MRAFLAFLIKPRTCIPLGAGAVAAALVGLLCGLGTEATLAMTAAAAGAFLIGLTVALVVDEAGVQMGWWSA